MALEAKLNLATKSPEKKELSIADKKPDIASKNDNEKETDNQLALITKLAP